MRLSFHGVISDHALMVAAPDAHHPRVDTFRFAINGQAIAGLSAWEKRINVGSGHMVVRVIVRGQNVVTATRGHDGVWAVGTDGSAQSSANGLQPYGVSSYWVSYVGGYSRLHGDAYLSGWSMFGANIRLRDVWIDGDEVVLEFFNVGTGASTVKAWGSGVVK